MIQHTRNLNTLQQRSQSIDKFSVCVQVFLVLDTTGLGKNLCVCVFFLISDKPAIWQSEWDGATFQSSCGWHNNHCRCDQIHTSGHDNPKVGTGLILGNSSAERFSLVLRKLLLTCFSWFQILLFAGVETTEHPWFLFRSELNRERVF